MSKFLEKQLKKLGILEQYNTEYELMLKRTVIRKALHMKLLRGRKVGMIFVTYLITLS